MRLFGMIVSATVLAGCASSGRSEPPPTLAAADAPPAKHRFGEGCEQCGRVAPARWGGQSDWVTDAPEPSASRDYTCPSDGKTVRIEAAAEDVVDRIGNVLVMSDSSGLYCCRVAPDCFTGLGLRDVNPFCIGRMACLPALYVGGRK